MDTGAADTGGHPPTETLSEYARGGLDPVRRAALEQHLGACALCRAIAGGLGAAPLPPPATGTTPSSAPQAPRGATPRRLPWRLILIVAALALGAWWWFGRGSSGGSGGTGGAEKPPAAAARLEDALAAAARDVAAAQPDLFAGFTLLDAETLRAAKPEAAGGIAVIGPREVVLAPRPAFRWHASGRAQVHTLALRGSDGKEAWSKRIDGVGTPFPADAPELARGSSWTWSVRARRQSGPVEGALTFRVASAEEAQRFEAQEKAVRAKAPAPVADLLLAHVALRAGLLEEAERLLTAKKEAKPRPGIEAETLAYVRARLGLDAGR